MKAIPLLFAAICIVALQGCSVNVIVAPHAGLNIDSMKSTGDTYSDAYLEDEGEYEVLPQAQAI